MPTSPVSSYDICFLFSDVFCQLLCNGLRRQQRAVHIKCKNNVPGGKTFRCHIWILSDAEFRAKIDVCLEKFCGQWKIQDGEESMSRSEG